MCVNLLIKISEINIIFWNNTYVKNIQQQIEALAFVFHCVFLKITNFECFNPFQKFCDCLFSFVEVLRSRHWNKKYKLQTQELREKNCSLYGNMILESWYLLLSRFMIQVRGLYKPYREQFFFLLIPVLGVCIFYFNDENARLQRKRINNHKIFESD